MEVLQLGLKPALPHRLLVLQWQLNPLQPLFPLCSCLTWTQGSGCQVECSDACIPHPRAWSLVQLCLLTPTSCKVHLGDSRGMLKCLGPCQPPGTGVGQRPGWSMWLLARTGFYPSWAVSHLSLRLKTCNSLHDMRRHTAGVRTVPGRKSWGSALRGDL